MTMTTQPVHLRACTRLWPLMTRARPPPSPPRLRLDKLLMLISSLEGNKGLEG